MSPERGTHMRIPPLEIDEKAAPPRVCDQPRQDCLARAVALAVIGHVDRT